MRRPILQKRQSLADIKRFCASRLAAMPPIESWHAWRQEAEQIRRRVLDEVVFRGVPSSWRAASRRIEWLEDIPGGDGYRIRKLRYEAVPGLWIPALLYEPVKMSGRVPVVLNVNGHDRDGKAAPYKQVRCINLAKRGCLALNVEWLGMGQLSGSGFTHSRLNELDLCGVSGLAVFYLAMERALDVLVEHPRADADRVAMAGLSGGGWQTIMLSALDGRVTLANPVAGYSSFHTRLQEINELGDSEQTPTDLAAIADYTHLTALRAPRPTLLTYNAHDECCFVAASAMPPLLDAVRPIYRLANADAQLRTHVNHDPGTHNFERENREALYRLMGECFFADREAFAVTEIDCADELKSAEELDVALPSANLDLHRLALALAADLPHLRPSTGGEHLRAVLRLPKYQPAAELAGQAVAAGLHARYWRLKLGNDWTTPLVELWRGEPQRTACVVADGGRTDAADRIEQLLEQRYRVLAVDPVLLGEASVPERGNLWAMLVASVGARPLGVQAAQLQAVARWARTQLGCPVSQLTALGPRTSLAALVATASADREQRPQGLMLTESLASLQQILENDWSIDDYPELFCFGLYQSYDVDDLIELARPCEVVRD